VFPYCMRGMQRRPISGARSNQAQTCIVQLSPSAARRHPHGDGRNPTSPRCSLQQMGMFHSRLADPSLGRRAGFPSRTRRPRPASPPAFLPLWPTTATERRRRLPAWDSLRSSAAQPVRSTNRQTSCTRLHRARHSSTVDTRRHGHRGVIGSLENTSRCLLEGNGDREFRDTWIGHRLRLR
jgi:hypothetical protein